MNKNSRAGQVYNWLMRNDKQLKIINFMHDNNIEPIEVFQIISEMCFSGYNKAIKNITVKQNIDYAEEFESIINYYHSLIEQENKELSKE